ncbi:DUF6480 family protein [Streptacidiphilus sp. PAMC 29251]
MSTSSFLTPGGIPARGPAPTETPECESSTGLSISTRDPHPAHDEWWTWAGLTAVALVALFTAGFMIARIFAG